MAEYIETDQCAKACGVDRKSLGISSDTLLDPYFLNRLCSPACYEKCPNIVELYFNMAQGEGNISHIHLLFHKCIYYYVPSN